MTLEEAQERILELEAQNTELTNERDTLSKNNESLTADLEKVRTLNQKYFERLSQQDVSNNQEDPEPAKTCEDFAKDLTI